MLEPRKLKSFSLSFPFRPFRLSALLQIVFRTSDLLKVALLCPFSEEAVQLVRRSELTRNAKNPGRLERIATKYQAKVLEANKMLRDQAIRRHRAMSSAWPSGICTRSMQHLTGFMGVTWPRSAATSRL